MSDTINISILGASGFVGAELIKLCLNHPNINTVRKISYGFQFGDLEDAYSHFSDDARIEDINQPSDTSFSLKEGKKNDEVFLNNYEIQSIDEWGYPDYLESVSYTHLRAHET